MESGFSILMFIFAAMILLYAFVLYLAKDPKLIPRHYAARMENKEEYAEKVARVMFIVAAAPVSGGIAGLFFSVGWGLLTLVIGFVFFIWLGIRIVWKRK